MKTWKSGGYMLISTVLNMELAKSQGLTQDDVDALEVLHSQKDSIFQSAAIRRMYPDSCVGFPRRGIVLALEQIEFSMQRLWKFSEDRDYHTWWCKLPGCGCRSLVYCGEKTRYIREDCEYHGTEDV
jgi:hypothetical protein